MDTNKQLNERKQFELLLSHYLYINDWKELMNVKLNDWQKDMLIDFFSDIAHDRVMEEISYEDYLTDEAMKDGVKEFQKLITKLEKENKSQDIPF